MNTVRFMRHEAVKNPLWQRWSRLTWALCAGGLLLSSAAHADFVNGNFEATPALDGWTQNGLVIPARIPNFPPVTAADLGLKPNAANNRSAVLDAATDASTNNQLSWQDRVARVHTSDHASGMSNRGSSIEQEITISAADVDADGRVHIRFTAAPVLESPNHDPNEQPYFFIEITKDDGTTLFSTFNFASQAGIPWVVLTDSKGVPTVTYTDWQAFDIPLDPKQVAVGSKVTLKVIAAGCGKGGHTGAVYLNNVRTSTKVSGTSLWVTAEGPGSVKRHTNPDGTTDVTYTYVYKNDGNTTVNNVTVQPAMPETTDATPKSTSFVAIGKPSFGGGSCTAPAAAGAAATCNIGTLAAGESGMFTMTVRVPADTRADQLNNGTYPIAGDSVPTLLGPLVKTALLADMVPDLSQLPASTELGANYSGSFSCTNQGATTALAASCTASGLPQGVTVGQCTLSPSSPLANWAAGDSVPPAATVTCPVSGTVSVSGATTVSVTADASNDGDKSNNLSTKPVSIAGPDMSVDLAGLPSTAVITKPYSGHFTCTNVGTVRAASGTVCVIGGLPPGVSQGACTIGSAASAWKAGDAVPAGEVVTCAVGGTVNAMSRAIVVGHTDATGDSNPANNTATLLLSLVPAAPQLVVDLSGLPRSGVVGAVYKGSFTCSNIGTADATTGTSCVAAGLPKGVSQGACTISPNGKPWSQADVIAEAAVVTCAVSGTLEQTGTSTATGTAGTATATADVLVTTAPVATPVPSLSQWGQMLMAGLLVLAAALSMRRRHR